MKMSRRLFDEDVYLENFDENEDLRICKSNGMALGHTLCNILD